jgi:hypothetical protein
MTIRAGNLDEMVSPVRQFLFPVVSMGDQITDLRTVAGQAGIIRRPINWHFRRGPGVAGFAGDPVSVKVPAGQRVGCRPGIQD